MFEPIGFTLKIIASPGFIAGVAFTVLLLIIGHWFPWQEWLGRPIGRLWAYTYGTATLWLGFTIWRAWHGDLTTPLGLGLICLTGGLAVVGIYRFDAYILSRARRRRHNLANHGQQEK